MNQYMNETKGEIFIILSKMYKQISASAEDTLSAKNQY